MRETVNDWRNDWIAANGPTDELEAVIYQGTDESPALYAGSFVGIPENLLPRKVMECGRILASSMPEREGAYSLTV